MDASRERDTAARVIGRYVLFREVAHGGMATVHLGRLRGVGGFARTVAIKRLHPPFARDPEFVSMFLDEARLAARIQHPNVVPVLDVVASGGELFLVMEYVHGEGLSKLLKRARAQGIAPPARLVIGILVDVLYGLHAAHEARNERGDPLDVVHRDVSPQNVLVGVDGVARVLDFGIAKAAQCVHAETRVGQLKGKLGYMAPEQIAAAKVDRRVDVYAAGVTLWEALTGERMFTQRELPHLIAEILTREHVPPSRIAPGTSPELDAVVMRALERDPKDRHATAADMAADLERVVPLPSRREIGEWVARVADGALRSRAASIAEIETTTFGDPGAVPEDPPSVEIPTARAPADEAIPVEEVEIVTADPVESPAVVSPSRGRQRARAWLAGCAVAALCVPVALVARVRRSSPSSADLRPTVAAATAAAVVVAAQPPTVPPPPSVVAPPPPGAASAPTASAPAVVPAAQPRVPVTEASARRAPAAPTTAKTGAPNDCTPPYTVDPSGVRVPKRWCL